MRRKNTNVGSCILCSGLSLTKGLYSAHYKQYYPNNHEKENKTCSDFNKNNKHKLVERKRKREAIDLNYRLANRLRNKLYSAVIGGSAIDNLGCSIEELKKHLESQFKLGVTWNYGKYGWHIDHIRPLVTLDLSTEDSLKIACNYTNLRPL